MTKIRIVVMENDKEKILEVLQNLGLIDFRKSDLLLPDDKPGEAYSSILAAFDSIDRALKALPNRTILPEKQVATTRLLVEVEKEKDTAQQIMDLVDARNKLHARELPSDYSTYNEEKKKVDEELGKIDAELNTISDRHYSHLAALREMLQIVREREAANYMFKKTGSTCIMEGWIPSDKKDVLIKVVAKASSGRFDISDVKTEELQPTSFNGPNALKPFAYLVDLFSVPRSDEIHPAWFMVLAFPLFYGLMVSDVGYGVVSLILSFAIARRTSPTGLWYNMAKIWQFASIATIIFGIFNNSYFGFRLDQYIIPSFAGFDWQHNMSTVIIVAILIGLFQTGIGLIIGFINNYRRNLKVVALSKILLLSLLITGTVFVAGLLFHSFSYLVTVATGLISLASLVTLLTIRPNQYGRVMDLIVYPISYIRIMGFGITSIVLALVIDEVFTPSLSSGIGIFIVYLVIFCSLHFINMALSTFEGAVQGMRLNFLEFFEEFYTGKGTKYRPFSFRRTYTKE